MIFRSDWHEVSLIPMKTVKDLKAVDGVFSKSLGVPIVWRSAFIETGYNYLATIQAKARKGEIARRRKEFEETVREHIKQPTDVQLLEILNKIAEEFDIPGIKALV